MRKLLAVLALLLAATAAPAGAGSLAMVASTARLDYFAEKGERVDVRRTEQFLTDLEKQFGHTVRGRYRLVRYRDAERLVQATGYYASGVTLPHRQEVHSTLSFHPHELVHVVASSVGDPGVVFQEGLAVVLGDEGRVEGRPVRSLSAEEAAGHTYQDVADRFRLGGAGPDQYRMAAGFVAWLEETRGRDTLLAFFAACPRAAAAPARFQQTYGRTIEAAWKEFQESRPRRRARPVRVAAGD